MPRPAIPHPHNDETPAQSQARIRATSWRYDAQMEHLARLKRDDRPTFDRLPSTSRMSLGMYEQGKTAAGAYGIDTSAPDAA